MRASMQQLDEWSIWSSPTSIGLYSIFNNEDHGVGTDLVWPSLNHGKSTPARSPPTTIFKPVKFGSSINCTAHMRKTSSCRSPKNSTSYHNFRCFTHSGMCKTKLPNVKHDNTNISPMSAKVKCCSKSLSKISEQGNDCRWKNRFDVLGSIYDQHDNECTSNDDQLVEDKKGLKNSNNKYKFTKKQIKYLKNAKRSNFEIKHRSQLAFNDIGTLSNSSSYTGETKQLCDTVNTKIDTNFKSEDSTCSIVHVFDIKLGSQIRQLSWPYSTIDISSLKHELHSTLNMHAQCSIYVNQQAVNDEQFIISSKDTIEIFICGSGGGRTKRGSGVHPDYECSTCSICSKNKSGQYFIH